MITVNLRDPNLKENLEALKELRDSGMFTDEALQELYDRQFEIDKKGVKLYGNTEQLKGGEG